MSWKNKMKHVLQYKESCVISEISNLANISSKLWKQNIFSSLLPHLLQMIERTNVFSKVYDIFDILGFSIFLYLPQTTQ